LSLFIPRVDRESFESLRGWMDLTRSHALPSTRVNVVGNKYDLPHPRVVDCSEGERQARLFNVVCGEGICERKRYRWHRLPTRVSSRACQASRRR
jgi:hypothetical protein